MQHSDRIRCDFSKNTADSKITELCAEGNVVYTKAYAGVIVALALTGVAVVTYFVISKELSRLKNTISMIVFEILMIVIFGIQPLLTVNQCNCGYDDNYPVICYCFYICHVMICYFLIVNVFFMRRPGVAPEQDTP